MYSGYVEYFNIAPKFRTTAMLLIAATNGPLFIPLMIYEYGALKEW